MHLVTLIYDNYPEYPALEVFTSHFLTIQSHALTHLPTTVTTLTNVFRLFQQWAANASYHAYFLAHPIILHNILLMYTSPRLVKPVFDAINNIVIDLLECESQPEITGSLGHMIASQLLSSL